MSKQSLLERHALSVSIVCAMTLGLVIATPSLGDGLATWLPSVLVRSVLVGVPLFLAIRLGQAVWVALMAGAIVASSEIITALGMIDPLRLESMRPCHALVTWPGWYLISGGALLAYAIYSVALAIRKCLA